MARQHVTPLMIAADGGGAVALTPLALTTSTDGVSEAAIQALVQAHPSCLPIAEIDPLFAQPVPICIELNTPAGSIDNFMVTPSGLPVLVECKLWRNPEGRREVVGQILDYAKELSRWTASDLQREVSRRLKREGNPLLDLVREAGHEVDEIAFNDALTLNLRRGRFLLLIVGDGIREGVEAITEYLQTHAGLHFTLGLVEMPIYVAPDGARLVVPRVLARTQLISREVVAIPEGFAVVDASSTDPDVADASILTPEESSRRDFMLEVISGLKLDDPEQPNPRVSPKGWLYLYMPAPASSCWVSVLDKRSSRQVGVRLSSNVNTVGEAAIRQVVSGWPTLARELGGTTQVQEKSPNRFTVEEFLSVDRQSGAEERERAIMWLRTRINDYVTAFRPRVRSAVDNLGER